MNILLISVNRLNIWEIAPRRISGATGYHIALATVSTAITLSCTPTSNGKDLCFLNIFLN